MKDTIFSWIFKRLFKTYGRLKFFALKTELLFFEPNGGGGFKKCKGEDASAIKCSAKIKLYNRKDVPIRLDNMFFLFERENDIFFELPIYFPKEINIPPWESISIELSSGLREINHINLKDVINFEKTYFFGKLPNNKSYKKLIEKKP